MKHRLSITFFGLLLSLTVGAQPIINGDEQTSVYLPLIRGKNIAIVANQSSIINKRHIVDSLLSLGISIKQIFSPEHGFRGDADAGEHVNNNIDSATKIPIISLYGDHVKPTKESMAGISAVIFDIQDVGVRFYTFISTMHYVMEACAENNILFIVLDRPNPNGYYIDGPVLEPKYKSFIGLHPVPIVYGMTIGEYAYMINGEKWLANGVKCNLSVVRCTNYKHSTKFDLKIKPSPNLPNARSIQLYPTFCLFEGTVMSMARGTAFPFQAIGHPGFTNKSFSFKPQSIPHICKTPALMGQTCYGLDYRSNNTIAPFVDGKLNISIIIYAYKNTILKDKQSFFTSFFYKLSGTDKLRQQIQDGMTEDQIRATWQNDLEKFKDIRKKYLLYKDF